MTEHAQLSGKVVAELRDSNGRLKAQCTTHNLITDVGDQYYAGRAVLAAGLPAQVTGMKLGSGSTAPAKNGAGAALVTYLGDSHQALSSQTAVAGVATFAATWAPGKATAAVPVTEVVLVTDALANATSSAANTISRALLTGIPAKEAGDTLSVTWTHTLIGG